MNKESLVYLVAAGLFAAAAGVSVGYDGAFGVAEGALLVAAVAMAAMAMRRPRVR